MKLYEPFQFLTDQECDELINYAQDKIKNGTTLGKYAGRNNRVAWYKESKYWANWINILKYTKGGHYDWHVDTWPQFRTHIRHFTLTCELQSAPGGKLVLENNNFILRRGQAIIFKPSDRHKAVSPTGGERISFTIWAMAKNANKVDRS